MTIKLTIGGTFAALALASTAHAGTILDQSSLPATGEPSGSMADLAPADRGLGQSFVAGATGELTRIDLALTNDSGASGEVVNFYLQDAAKKYIFAGYFKFEDLTPSSEFSWDKLFNLNLTGVKVTAGERYELVLNPSAQLGYRWVDDTSYAKGSAFIRTGGGGSDIPQGRDIAFRTYVADATGAVPEPATWAMMIMGLGSAGAVLRRKRALAFA